LDYSQLNTQRLRAFNNSDVRIDIKINLKKITFDMFLDATNWYFEKNKSDDQYTWKRTAYYSAFETTDGWPIKAD